MVKCILDKIVNYDFKAKSINNGRFFSDGEWLIGNYTKQWSFDDNGLNKAKDCISIDNFLYDIDLTTLCRLITEINEVKIFEYDCYIDNNKNIYYLKYDNLGILTICVNYGNDKIDFEEWNYADERKVERIIKHKFIGNWHDGEQFLLDKIKELK